MIYGITFFNKINLHQTVPYHDINTFLNLTEFLNFLL